MEIPRGPPEPWGSAEQKDLESYSQGAWLPAFPQSSKQRQTAGASALSHPLPSGLDKTNQPHIQLLPCVGAPPRPTHPCRAFPGLLQHPRAPVGSLEVRWLWG